MIGVRASANFRGAGDLRLVGRQLHYEQLSFWRNPVGAIFTVVFSVLFLVLEASSGGTSRLGVLGGQHAVQYFVPGFAAYGVMSACFTTLTISLVVRRETGLLKRLRLSPLPTWALVAGIVANALVVSALQVGAVLAIGAVGYHVRLPADPLALVVALVVGAVAFTALGMAVSTVVPNQEAAGPVTATVFFVLLFLSGLWYPLQPGSALAQFSAWFPVRHFILAVFAPFDFRPGVSAWDWGDLAAVAAWGAVGFFVALRRFRFEPRRTG